MAGWWGLPWCLSRLSIRRLFVWYESFIPIDCYLSIMNPFNWSGPWSALSWHANSQVARLVCLAEQADQKYIFRQRREDRLIRSLPVACSVFKTNALELETAMSVDQGVIKGTLSFPSYLGVKPGDVVLVWDHPELVDSDSSAWWVGEVIVIDRSVRDSREPSLFQVADVDSGVIRWVNADCVQKLCLPLNSPDSKLIAFEDIRVWFFIWSSQQCNGLRAIRVRKLVPFACWFWWLSLKSNVIFSWPTRSPDVEPVGITPL